MPLWLALLLLMHSLNSLFPKLMAVTAHMYFHIRLSVTTFGCDETTHWFATTAL
ncbi:hypothetical protein J2Y91_003138 [Erwinia aphidicola]|nr:hypothetical protein [Erwinia aphidicola]